MHDIDLREIFECAHLKFTVSGQTIDRYIDVHARAQCSHASVGLAQAHPNKDVTTMLATLLHGCQRSGIETVGRLLQGCQHGCDNLVTTL